jgi:hypothetical protein
VSQRYILHTSAAAKAAAFLFMEKKKAHALLGMGLDVSLFILGLGSH